MSSPDEGEKRIIIDDDWKSRVQREKEQMLRADENSADPLPADDQEWPAASFMFLVMSMATQAMVALGQIPDPVDGKLVLRSAMARHYIDMLGVLEEKTKGNLDTEEQQYLQEVLRQLRFAFVAVTGGRSHGGNI